MLLATHFLSEEIYFNASKKGVNIFLYNEINFIPPLNTPNATFYNCNAERVQSSWFIWEENNRIIQHFKKNNPSFFEIHGYDMTLAIQKAMFWSNYKTGMLWYSVSKYFKSEEIYYLDDLHVANRLGVLLKYLKSKIKHSNKEPEKQVDTNYSYAIHVKNNFQIGMYQGLINKIIDNPKFKLFVDPNIDSSFSDSFAFKESNYCKGLKSDYALPSVNPFALNQEDWYTLGIILNHWDEIVKGIDLGRSISHQDLKAALVNEAENGVYGAVLSEVLVKNNTIVYNTMNGIKSGEAQDAYINFTKWFVWDKEMKKLLMEENRLKEDQLIVSGHLIEDFIKDYQYRNSLDIDLNELKGKKVISLFSVKGKRFVKFEAMKILNELLKENDSYFLIIRPHPGELPSDYLTPDPAVKNITFLEYNQYTQNETLHDQLYISDLSIVFGSTVALDSRWMGVPCISFETREKSFIYNIDNEMIFHAKTADDLRQYFYHCLQIKQNTPSERKQSVADFILETIQSN